MTLQCKLSATRGAQPHHSVAKPGAASDGVGSNASDLGNTSLHFNFKAAAASVAPQSSNALETQTNTIMTLLTSNMLKICALDGSLAVGRAGCGHVTPDHGFYGHCSQARVHGALQTIPDRARKL